MVFGPAVNKQDVMEISVCIVVVVAFPAGLIGNAIAVHQIRQESKLHAQIKRNISMD